MSHELEGITLILRFALLCMIVPAALVGQEVGPLAEHVEVVGSLSLEESDSVLTVTPVVNVDPRGGFIVTDASDSQVRLYDQDGNLEKLVATRGSGPGEVVSPLFAMRRPNGRILVPDMANGAILEFDASGERELERYPMPFPVVRLVNLGNEVLAVGLSQRRSAGGSPQLLHIWDGDFENESFFPAPITDATASLASSYGYASAAVWGDEIVGTYSLSDTLYLHSRTGNLVERIHLDLRHWSLPESRPAGGVGSRERRQWMEQLTRIFDVHTSGDLLLVQYAGHRDSEIVWRLACVTREGEVLFDVLDTPRLLAVDDDRLYFVHAESMTEDRWVVARLR